MCTLIYIEDSCKNMFLLLTLGKTSEYRECWEQAHYSWVAVISINKIRNVLSGEKKCAKKKQSCAQLSISTNHTGKFLNQHIPISHCELDTYFLSLSYSTR